MLLILLKTEKILQNFKTKNSRRAWHSSAWGWHYPQCFFFQVRIATSILNVRVYHINSAISLQVLTLYQPLTII